VHCTDIASCMNATFLAVLLSVRRAEHVQTSTGTLAAVACLPENARQECHLAVLTMSLGMISAIPLFLVRRAKTGAILFVRLLLLLLARRFIRHQIAQQRWTFSNV
jgi:hypothetical protein